MTAAGSSAAMAPRRPGFEESLAHEALARIGPILRQADEKGTATVMYLALIDLQKSYPKLAVHELEILLRQIMRLSGLH